MKAELEAKCSAVENALKCYFTEKTDYSVLLEAMGYSLMAGGKRLRPVFLLAFCEAVGGVEEKALPAACAVEMVHTYSLIHDDLPCMDNDDFRRGRPTCHKVYGDDIATLAGDALLTAAFETLSTMEVPAEQAIACVRLLSAGAGEHGMVAGQVLDMEGEKHLLTEEELRAVHIRKTGCLIRAACQMGTVLGGGTEQQIAAAGDFAIHLGLAFQIRDDMLDEISSQEQLGKPIGSDVENGKSTFVTLFGLEQCQRLVEQETEKALAALQAGNFKNTDFLERLALSLTSRMS